MPGWRISWFNIFSFLEPRTMTSIRILIVDDHEIVRRGIRSLLSSRADFEVCGEASDGMQGVQKAKELQPNLVLMDISMPKMTGLEATRLIRRDLPDVQVILVSQEENSRESEVRVLVADDNSDMREYVARLLGSRWTVETAADGFAALESIRKRPPTLVVTDVMMPRVEGFELLREIRKDPATRRIPVVMLSARAGEESRVEGLEAGADDYIVKPFTARELTARVAARLDLHRLGTLLEKERSAIDSLFEQTPVAFAVLTGPDVVYSIANQAYREVVGDRDVRGKPILEALPELKGQGFDTLAREVMRTGKAYVGREALVKLDRMRTG
jgi:CheY-like chemotaxis protein